MMRIERLVVVMVAALTVAPIAVAVIVDGVAISVGNKVITRSEIDQRIRLAAFQSGVQPDMGGASRREAAQRLIEQKLIAREMDLGHYPRRDANAGQAMLAAYAKANFGGDETALKTRAAEYGLTPAEVGAELVWQSDFLTFLNLRFRPAVQVTEEQIRKYFAEKFAARVPAGQQESSLSELHAQIEEQLTIEGSDRELDVWLKDQRQRTRIDFVEKDLQEQGAK